MTDAEYLTYLYDLAARRYGYTSHEEWATENGALTERIAADMATGEAQAQEWAKAQLKATGTDTDTENNGA